MIDIDLDSVSSNLELADVLEQQFEPQTTTFFASLEGSYAGMVIDAGMNCGVLSSVKSMAKQASGQFLADIQKASKAVEEAIADITKGVGDIIKHIRSAVDAAIAKVKEFANWIRDQIADVVETAKAAIQQAINTINDVINSAMDAVNEVISAIGDLATEMLDSVKNISLRVCESMSLSLEDVGIGAGIDAIVDVVTAPVEQFAENLLGGMKNKVASYESSLSALTDDMPTGATQANSIRTSFNSIDDLIAGIA